MYDFDGTLFRSTDKPEWFINQFRWWGVNEQSLSPPCVPENPGPDWWIKPVVSHAHQDGTDPATLSILVTGRLKSFAPRVYHLLSTIGLKFDFYYFLPGSDASVKGYKVDILTRMLEENPTITELHLWEDQNLSHYGSTMKAWAASKGRVLDVRTHNIRTQPHDNVCVPSDFPPGAIDQTRVAMLTVQDYKRFLA